MRSTKTNRHSPFPPGVLCLTILLLILLLPVSAGAADYWVWGRVYSASPLAQGEELPDNPLSDVFTSHPERIIGENLIPQVPRNLVKVQVIRASDGSELGNYLVSQDGGYLISFSATGASISVRFIVEELATSKVLSDSDPIALSPWPTPNMYFLLVAEASAEIDNDREYAAPPPLPAKYTAIFTRVGKIEVATEVGGTTQHLIDPATGLVNVPSTVAADLQIPAYEDAPFGGNLYIFGAFSRKLYDLPVHYRIHIQNVDDPTDHWYMGDKLVKTKYTVNFTTGKVKAERVTLGPKDVGGVLNCYELTPVAAGNDTFWSFPDLVALWRTGQFNGRYEITLEIVGLSIPAEFAAIDDYTDITLRLDNVAPVAKIDPLQAGDYDTPRVYTPGSVPTSDDLLDNLLEAGTFPATYGGTANPTCLILNLQPPSPTKYLAFNLTGYHTNGFLRYWYFKYERNDKKNEILMGKKYEGTTNSMVDYSTGMRISSLQTAVTGFQDKYLYLDTDHLQPLTEPSPLGGCAYRFVIGLSTRTTDGYHYLRYRWDQDLHYVQR